jgi:hypothetical protein
LNGIFVGYTGSRNPVQTRKKNPVYQTGNFKLENAKNQVQINLKKMDGSKKWIVRQIILAIMLSFEI